MAIRSDPPRSESNIDPPSGYLGVPEASAELHVHPDTVRALIKRGALPALKVGQRYRIQRSDLQNLSV